MKSLSFLSDFNLEPLIRILKNSQSSYKISNFSFSNIHQQLIKNLNKDFSIVWINPENLFLTLIEFSNGKKLNFNKLEKEIQIFVNNILKNKIDGSKVILMSFFDVNEYPQNHDYLYKTDQSPIFIYNYINNKISNLIGLNDEIFFIDVNKIALKFADEYTNYKFKISTKSNFTINFYNYVGKFLIDFLNKKLVPPKKLIILDLDDTLWGGVVGEIGWENINLGGNDPIGEAHQDFQKKLLLLKKSGIQLAIASKNEESVALKAIEKNNQMILKKKDFVSIMINWDDKAKNIVKISKKLNLGLDSFVFFDNSEFERKNVQSQLPEILTPDLIEGPLEYVNILNSLKCFDNFSVTKEDKIRTKLYKENSRREKLLKTTKDKNAWIKKLYIKVKAEKLSSKNQVRTLQLLNKTNQMNLRTNRYTEKKLKQLNENPKKEIYTFEVSDKFGNYGLTGIISYEIFLKKAVIIDFVLSCRVMGRNAEDRIVEFVKKKIKKREIIFNYLITPKNKPMLNYLNSSKLLKLHDKKRFIYKSII